MSEANKKFEVRISFMDGKTANIKKKCHQVDQQGECLRLVFAERVDSEGQPHMRFILYPLRLVRNVEILELDRPIIVKPTGIIPSVAEAAKH